MPEQQSIEEGIEGRPKMDESGMLDQNANIWFRRVAVEARVSCRVPLGPWGARVVGRSGFWAGSRLQGQYPRVATPLYSLLVSSPLFTPGYPHSLKESPLALGCWPLAVWPKLRPPSS